MSERHEPFQQLYKRFQAGDPEACQQLYHSCRAALLPRLRRRLSNHLQALYDAEDVFQRSFCVFLEDLVNGVFTDLNQMVACLHRLACRRLHNIHRRCLDGKHHSERGRQALDAAPEEAFADPAPGPDAVVERHDWWRTLCLDRPNLARLMELTLAGYKQGEVAEAFGITDRQVRRLYQALAEAALALDGLGPCA